MRECTYGAQLEGYRVTLRQALFATLEMLCSAPRSVADTVTRCEYVAVLPCASTAVQTTVAVPIGKVVGALLDTDTVVPQMSTAVAVPMLGAALQAVKVTSGGVDTNLGGPATVTLC